MNFPEFLIKHQKVPVVEYPNDGEANPVVSVCVQTYQHVNYIKQCIDSIIMQKTNFVFEILIGDDESNDGTRETCIEYAQKYPEKIRLLLHSRENNIQIKGNPSGRFNFLYNLFAANGKYIAICEGDDYWTDPYKLQKQVDFLEANLEYGLVHTNHDSFYQLTGKIKKNIRSIPTMKDGNIFKTLLARNQIGTLTALVRKELILNAVKKHETKIIEWYMGDYPLWLEISRQSKIKFIKQSMAVHRVGHISATNPGTIAGKIKFITSSEEVCKYFFQKYAADDKILLKQIDYNYAKIRFRLAFFCNNKDDLRYFFIKMKNNKSGTVLPIFVLIKYYLSLLGLNSSAKEIDRFLKKYLD